MRRHACYWIGPVLFVLLLAAIIFSACSDKPSGPEEIPAAKIASISPERGPVGTRVEIKGEDFGEDKGSIEFGDQVTFVPMWSDTLIKADVPEQVKKPCYVYVSSEGSNETDSIHFIVEAIVIESIVPDHGLPGNEITIIGSGFGSETGSVVFDSLESAIVSWSDNEIVVLVPENATSCNVEVRSQGMVSNLLGFAVDMVTITSVTPTEGIPGTEVIIEGVSFGEQQGVVTINGIEAEITYWSATEIRCLVPAEANSGDLIVHREGNESNAVHFDVYHMIITSVEPDSGIVGQKIAIHGEYFGPTPGSVYFGDFEAPISSWTDSLIYTTIPENASSDSVWVGNQYEISNKLFYFIKQNPPLSELLHATNYIETHFKGFGKYQHCVENYYGGSTCDTSEGGYTTIEVTSEDVYGQELAWIGDSLFVEYEFFSHGPDGIYNIHLKIDGKIAENGDSILELYAFFNNGYGTAHHYSWSGQAIYIKNLKLLANNGLETGIIYQALASSVIDSYIGVSMSSFTNDMDISNSSSTLIEVDLEKPGYPPELKVIFRQK